MTAGKGAPGEIWNDPLREDCPFPRSTELTGLTFTGRSRNYTNADTFYPSWAADGALYSPWTDGCFGETVRDPLDCSSKSDDPSNAPFGHIAATGQARITGDDPLDLSLENLGLHRSASAPFGGRYPSASLVKDGVWYYGTYCLDETGRTNSQGKPYNWDVLGPFVGFRRSIDGGRSWVETRRTPSDPLFGDTDRVRFGAPHFVDFGRNMQGSPDGMAYLVGHGAAAPSSWAAWIRGDEVNLARTIIGPETADLLASWEFFAGSDATGAPVWSSDIADMVPLLRWEGHLGHVTITRFEALDRYIMCLTDGGDTISEFDSYILESRSLTGPWAVVSLMEHFGDQAYFLNFPTKFIAADGLTAWLCFSANYTIHHLGLDRKIQPATAKYAMSLHEVRMERR